MLLTLAINRPQGAMGIDEILMAAVLVHGVVRSQSLNFSSLPTYHHQHVQPVGYPLNWLLGSQHC